MHRDMYDYQCQLTSPKVLTTVCHADEASVHIQYQYHLEDAFRRKGPSKENKKEPIVGMGLLLDVNQIPIGMKLYPGNESEKPVLRNIIDDLKTRNSISGKTIQVADKGLNCAENIIHALKSGDGYIFSKSVKLLPETEMTWVLLDNDYRDVTDKNGRFILVINWINPSADT